MSLKEADEMVCLQINLTPADVRYATHTLPHQLRMLGSQVDEIQFTVDQHHSPGSRFRVSDYHGNLAALHQLLGAQCKQYPQAYVANVDYSKTTMDAVASAFIGGAQMPKKTYDGLPIYAYFYGLARAQSPHVFHLDADMLLGGGSPTWVREALEILRRDRRVLACNPLPGPPTADGGLRSQTGERIDAATLTYRFGTLSSRIVLLDKRRFTEEGLKVKLLRAGLQRAVRAFLYNLPPYSYPETSLSALMREEGLHRIDFLGSGQGLWSVHPVYRTERFYEELPGIIERIEHGDVPDRQRGDHDLNDSMIDWSDAKRSLHQRMQRQIVNAAYGLADRIGALS